jgi:hypothetical protein
VLGAVKLKLMTIIGRDNTDQMDRGLAVNFLKLTEEAAEGMYGLVLSRDGRCADDCHALALSQPWGSAHPTTRASACTWPPSRARPAFCSRCVGPVS